MPGWTGEIDYQTGLLLVKPGGSYSGASSYAKGREAEAWVQGDIFCHPSFAKGNTSAEMLLNAFEGNNLERLLNEIDGVFSGILYDRSSQRLILVTDRLGMQPLFVGEDYPFFYFTTELKTLLGCKGFTPVMDADMMQCFLDTGQFLGEKTWFRGVRLLPAATMAVFSIRERIWVSEKRYWTWASIRPLRVEWQEAVEETGRLLKAAIQKRCRLSGNEGLLLSGGLDSRAVLAAFPEDVDIISFTVGHSEAKESAIAEMAAKARGVKHIRLDMTVESWFEGRLKSVWQTEGQCSFLHHHYTAFEGIFRANASAAWEGFIGDLVMGGSWIQNPGKRISSRSAQRRFGKWAEFADPSSAFFDFPSEDPFWIDTRCRRFTNIGMAWLEQELPAQRPFIDKELIDFIYGLPDAYRMHNKLYSEVLLRFFPKYFDNIPWRRTGFPLKYDRLTRAALFWKISSILSRIGVTRSFALYAKWIRQKPGELPGLLDPTNSLYPDFFGEDWRKKWLLPHLEGKGNFAEEISRAATLEYWLRCIFRQEYKNLE
jgi:asparagine synthase (glutamine-hydrolysing)